jgi:hypothetical protein
MPLIFLSPREKCVAAFLIALIEKKWRMPGGLPSNLGIEKSRRDCSICEAEWARVEPVVRRISRISASSSKFDMPRNFGPQRNHSEAQIVEQQSPHCSVLCCIFRWSILRHCRLKFLSSDQFLLSWLYAPIFDLDDRYGE